MAVAENSEDQEWFSSAEMAKEMAASRPIELRMFFFDWASS
jgi:hypothetical protein